jgi:hypothetical protein
MCKNIKNISPETYEEFNETYNFFQICMDCMYHGLLYIVHILNITLNTIIKIAGIYLLWILLHYIASHLYIYFCVPQSMYGFLISPFLITTPHCKALRWCIHDGSNIINNMWSLLGNWIISKIYIGV